MQLKLVIFSLFASVACAAPTNPSGDTNRPTTEKAAEDSSVTAPPAAKKVAHKETPTARCKRLLRRFADQVDDGEQDVCMEALKYVANTDPCFSEYDGCFDSCMNSVDFGPVSERKPGELVDPVANCRPGCFQTSCEADDEP